MKDQFHAVLLVTVVVCASVATSSEADMSAGSHQDHAVNSAASLGRVLSVSRRRDTQSQVSSGVCDTATVLNGSYTYEFVSDSVVAVFSPVQELADVLGLDEGGLPVVCLEGVPLPSMDLIFRFVGTVQTVASYVLLLISMAASSVVVFIYAFSKRMRSIFGLVAICSAISFFFNDFFLIIAGPVSKAVSNDSICLMAAIFGHYWSVTQYMWLAIFGIDFALRYQRIAKSRGHRRKFTVAILYSIFGWGISFKIWIAGIIGHFASRYVQYGMHRLSCRISDLPSFMFLSFIPSMVAVSVSLIAVVVILVYLCKLSSFSFKRTDRARFVSAFVFISAHSLVLFVDMLNSTISNTRFGFATSFLFLLFLCFRSIFFCLMLVCNKKVARFCTCCSRMPFSAITPGSQTPSMAALEVMMIERPDPIGGPAIAPPTPLHSHEPGSVKELRPAELEDIVKQLENPAPVGKIAWQ